MAERPFTPERIGAGKAAAICGFSTKTLVKYAKAGRIPGAAELLPGAWRFDERELRSWIRRREAECATAAATSTGGARHGGAGSRLRVATSDEAYERLLKQKRVPA